MSSALKCANEFNLVFYIYDYLGFPLIFYTTILRKFLKVTQR